MKVDIYQFYIALSEYTLTFSNHFFKIIELESSSSLKQTKRNMISAIKKNHGMRQKKILLFIRL